MPRVNQIIEDPFLPVSIVPLYRKTGEQSSRNSVILQMPEGPMEVGNVSSSYQLVPNKDVHDIALDVLERSELNFEDNGSLFDGKKYRQRWLLPELNVEPRPGDVVQLAADVVNSYDGSGTFGLSFVARRLVCENGMMIDHFLMGYRFRHYGHDDFARELDSAADKVRGLSGRLGPLSTKFQKMIETPIDRESIQTAFNELNLPQSVVAQSFMKIEEDNLWGLYNACTNVLTEQNSHRGETLNRQVSKFLLAA